MVIGKIIGNTVVSMYHTDTYRIFIKVSETLNDNHKICEANFTLFFPEEKI